MEQRTKHEERRQFQELKDKLSRQWDRQRVINEWVEENDKGE